MPAIIRTLSVEAVDARGDVFKKVVKFYFKNKRLIIDFKFPIQYDAKSLCRHFPATKSLCIDNQGMLHNGSPVFVKPKDFNTILLTAKELLSAPVSDQTVEITSISDTFLDRRRNETVD